MYAPCLSHATRAPAGFMPLAHGRSRSQPERRSWHASIVALPFISRVVLRARSHRREVAVITIWPWLTNSAKAEGADSLTDLSRGILGGDRDVFYPRWFLGEWEATTELASVEFPRGEAAAGREALRQRELLGTRKAVERYPQKYVDFDGQVVADRAYNMRGYIRGSGGGPRAFESVEWDPKNPNVLAVTIKRDGLSVKTETRVKKRSVGIPEGRNDLFNSSEVYVQEVSSAGDSGRDKVTPIRCVNKFKKTNDSEILVLQRLEIFPRLDGESATDLDKPSVIYKYRGVLARQPDSALSPNIKAL